MQKKRGLSTFKEDELIGYRMEKWSKCPLGDGSPRILNLRIFQDIQEAELIKTTLSGLPDMPSSLYLNYVF